MKRWLAIVTVAAFLVGFSLPPARADWGMGDWGTLKEIRTALVDLAAAHKLLATAEVRKAAALERLAAAAERAYPTRAER